MVDSTERGRHHCSGEFEQLLSPCSEGLIGSKFMLLQLAGMRTVLTYSTATCREMRFSMSFKVALKCVGVSVRNG